MKILIFSNYFPPEVGAASNRIFYLAKGLKCTGHGVEVVSPLPNYPKGEIFDDYKGSFRKKEEIEGITVNRFWIFATVSKNFFLRFLGMVSFALSFWLDIFHYFKEKPDAILIQHSPLLVSFSAMILTKLLPDCKRVLNVSDLWPLTALELGAMDRGIMYSIMEKIEHFNYKNAHEIIGQSHEILQHVKERCNKPLFLYRNISPQYTAGNINFEKYHNGQFKIVYAGLLGVAQGMYDLCRNVDFHKLGVELHIYGGGSEEFQISEYVEKNRFSNIYFHGSVPKDELHEILPQFHASIVPLANQIYGAVPSKIYELISFGVPILFCGGGEGANIIKENSVGFVSDPANFSQLEENISVIRNLTSQEYENILLNCKKMTAVKLNYKDQIKQLDTELKTLCNL
jgi:glycosyltransferase involved in cell wall biosynthesis